MKSRLFKIQFIFILFLSISIGLCSCNSKQKPLPENTPAFSSHLWKIEENNEYPYREHFVEYVLHDGSIRSLNKKQILQLLGKPTKENNNHVYYRISDTHLWFWPLHTKTIVFKFNADNRVEWIKIHE